MLDGKAYRTHFPDDPAYKIASCTAVRPQLNFAALREALAALKNDFGIILSQARYE
jgi:hypothetical protein